MWKNADEFPERVNLQICRQIDKGNLDIEIWERGSGYKKLPVQEAVQQPLQPTEKV